MSENLTHWKMLDNPDYIGAYALRPGEDKVVTIDSVAEETVTGTGGKKEQCLVAHLVGEKPFVLNRTNAKMISKVLGTPYIEQWRGRKIQLYATKVDAFGEKDVDALRVRPFIPKEDKPICADCGKEIPPYGKMNPAQVAQYTTQQYGIALCAECAGKRKAATDAAKGDNT